MEPCLKTDTVAQYSYNDIHNTVHKMAPAVKAFRPDVIVAIGGGGFIPARMLRAHFENVPIIAVSMEAYDDTTNTIRDSIKIHQWFDPLKGHGTKIHGGRVVIVDMRHGVVLIAFNNSDNNKKCRYPRGSNRVLPVRHLSKRNSIGPLNWC